MERKEAENRVLEYWTMRTRDFNTVRMNELKGELGRRWIAELLTLLPGGRMLDILDAGTGTGFFAVLLAKEGHRVTGIDLTPSMLEEAKRTAEYLGVEAAFLQRNVQETGFAEESFDAIVTRNVTWTLTDPEKAYREWYRILRPGGVLINFDANYADNVRNENQKESWTDPAGAYGHIGMTQELMTENARITLAMPASAHRRPKWDEELAEKIGFAEWSSDEMLGRRILREKDMSDAPMFLFRAVK